MKATPAKRYKKPVYPTRLQVLADPALLKNNLPPGWRAMPQMAGSVALFLAINSTLQAADKKPDGPPGATAIVAPVFEHGEGRGAVGCVVVSPPVFLSEEEAWQVIHEELAKQGVNISKTSFEISGVKIPRRTESYEVKDGKLLPRIEEASATPYKADGVDSQKHIAVEFVSQQDYTRLGGATSMSTVQGYDFKKTAASVSEQVAKTSKNKVYFGVLYDPATLIKEDRGNSQTRTPAQWQNYWKETTTKSKAESQRLLRLQVQDFLKWLQGQGVI